jgi:hypothetical protein
MRFNSALCKITTWCSITASFAPLFFAAIQQNHFRFLTHSIGNIGNIFNPFNSLYHQFLYIPIIPKPSSSNGYSLE